MRCHCIRFIALLAGILVGQTKAQAQVQIDQAAALAGGVTASDIPGFPIIIDTPGSYRLVGNLDLNNAPGQPGHGIVIAANNVTLDLNGFRIEAGLAFHGITDEGQARYGIVVRNGSISGFQTGIELTASSVMISGIRAAGAAGTGISVGPGSMVFESVSFDNGHGIFAGQHSIVSRNSVFGNKFMGIWTLDAAIVDGNSAARNGNNGILCAGGRCRISSNTLYANVQRGIHAGAKSLINNNSASDNVQDGIYCEDSCSIIGNVVNRNSIGIQTTCPGVIEGNAAANNLRDIVIAAGSGCSRANNYPPP